MHNWKKLGLLYDPNDSCRKNQSFSHAANPLPVLLDGDIYRVFFSGRDDNNRSSVLAVDIDIIKRKPLDTHSSPFITHGSKGSFYSDGISIGNCYKVGSTQYMLFMGWHILSDGHWRGEIGRLTVNSDLTLELANNTPFLGLDDTDPISLSYPWVMPNSCGGYHMWYGSTRTWDAGNEEMLHVINYASSSDGHSWKRDGLAIPFEIGKAQAFSRPTVIKNQGTDYLMWFSYRSGNGKKYRIGFATSHDGSNWELSLDKAGINVSPAGWDNEMIEYPFVFNHKGQQYMLYNGNGYGKTGFGLAILEHD
ncbi:hypothetical protein MNBD_GAMMA26-1808 [hydrothermal vent metagenome]|uniref:Glycosyl hydrolase family 32 N-terminal domain-containing protein n=1 Tax=hydrothermal vent metagenome TaxID=652676 RepID=A0A3B1C236_9ZZZZ